LSLKALIRRILGRRGTRILRNSVSTLYYALKLVEPPEKYRERGVSAVIWSKNEELWIELSMRSVAKVVDEYVLIDASTDRTPEIARNLGRELGIPVRIVRTFTSDIAEVGNLGLRNSRYKWILKWDPDFVLHEDNVSLLNKLIRDLDDTGKYYLIYWPHICLDGDLFHQSPISPLHTEHWLFTYHPKLHYTYIGWLEHLNVPFFYKRIDIEKPLSFHLRSVKPPRRLLYRHYWYEARRSGVLGKVSLDEYVRQRIIDDYGTSDVDEAAKRFLEWYISRLQPFDRTKYGDYPAILKDYVRRKLGITL